MRAAARGWAAFARSAALPLREEPSPPMCCGAEPSLGRDELHSAYVAVASTSDQRGMAVGEDEAESCVRTAVWGREWGLGQAFLCPWAKVWPFTQKL